MHFLRKIFRNHKKPILTLDAEAIERLNVERQTKNLDLNLEICIERNSVAKGKVFVGFSEKSYARSLVDGIIIKDEDLSYLDGGNLSFSREQGCFIYYPNVDLIWKESPNPKIKQVFVNKLFTSENQIWTSTNKSKYYPIQQILNIAEVVSVYAKANLMQIEFDMDVLSADLEETISELILIYFSDLYPRLGEA